MVNGQWSMVNGQWSMVNGQWSMVNGQWSIVPLVSLVLLVLLFSLLSHLGPRKRVAKFCDRVGERARAFKIAAIKKA